jgi:hypothetical protein
MTHLSVSHLVLKYRSLAAWAIAALIAWLGANLILRIIVYWMESLFDFFVLNRQPGR